MKRIELLSTSIGLALIIVIAYFYGVLPGLLAVGVYFCGYLQSDQQWFVNGDKRG